MTGKDQSLGAELLALEGAVLDAESAARVAADAGKGWELSGVLGKESLQLLTKHYN